MKQPLGILLTKFLLPLFILTLSSNSNAADQNNDIYGHWKIKSILGGGISSLSEREERSYIGKSVIISPTKFYFNQKTCWHPPYTRSSENVDKYFEREWRADVTDIPLPNPVTIVDAGCNVFYLMKKNVIIIAEDGVFFEAVRTPK
ncbi:MAG: hypothetical protein V4754_15180 [Pseudomonadota bacterium]